MNVSFSYLLSYVAVPCISLDRFDSSYLLSSRTKLSCLIVSFALGTTTLLSQFSFLIPHENSSHSSYSFSNLNIPT